MNGLHGWDDSFASKYLQELPSPWLPLHVAAGTLSWTITYKLERVASPTFKKPMIAQRCAFRGARRFAAIATLEFLTIMDG